MTTLEELERELDADLRRALAELMPRLERSAVDDVVETRRRVGWSAPATAAAGVIGVVAGLWWMQARPTEPTAPVSSAVESIVAPTIPPMSAGAGTAAPTSLPDHTLAPLPLDGLSPLEAARQVSVNELFSATEDEQADLDTAAEILRRDCLRAGGATPATVTAAHHLAARWAVLERFRAVTDRMRSDGLALIRAQGYDARRTDDPLFLPVQEGSLEVRLLIDGCNVAAASIEPTASQAAAGNAVVEFNNNRLFPEVFDASDHPIYGPARAAFADCITAAGYPEYVDEPGRTLSRFWDNEHPTSEELALAAADVDCALASGIPTALIDTLTPMVAEFAVEHADLIADLDAERDAALERARAVLVEHGIEPFAG